jgi:hypothetical protein
MYSKEIGLRPQNMSTFLGSIVNLIGETYMTTKLAQEPHFDNEWNKIFIRHP